MAIFMACLLMIWGLLLLFFPFQKALVSQVPAALTVYLLHHFPMNLPHLRLHLYLLDSFPIPREYCT
jgi:hypothetical protein